ncbi:MAG: ATP12 family chaperone protein [Rhizomicrobium sp.]
MKRFYKSVAVEETPEGFRFLLDGKPVRTPHGRRPFFLPSRALAETLKEEWLAQGEDMWPASMPLTRLANTVLDGTASAREEMVEAILRFGDNDLLSYRADHPRELALNQRQWDAWLDWAWDRYGARLAVTKGVAPIGQSPEALAAFRQAIEACDDFALIALHVLSSVTGSLTLGLAALEGLLTPARAFALSRLDETYQAEKWGADREALERSRRLALEMENAVRLVRLART